ncbi:MAG TPA: phosphate acyltransferase PlsX [Candidatus Dormibacteraeota bacterium]|nr:phosphate acyltransferase PlsX [Candidatus Dormibacteraeota bacterium]
MRIAIDAMGGDLAPVQIVEGAALAVRDLDVEVVMVGLPDAVLPLLERHTELRFVPATQVVGMEEHPANAIRAKSDSSMSVCARLVKDGEVDAWVSAGNSGAALAASLFILGRIRGVDRPALGSMVPTANGFTYLLDVGANVDCKAQFLVQFAQMGAAYAQGLLGLENPRIALLSNGEEPGKGDHLVREVYPRLERSGLNFVGNVEAKEMLAGAADVVVADGFLGNVAIKMAEATAEYIFRTLREEIPKSMVGKLGGLLIRPRVRAMRSRLDWREYGGAPLLGVDGVAVVAHGRSDALAIRNAIRVAKQSVDAGLVARIREAVT